MSKVLRYDERVPKNYVAKSRDFQTLMRLLTVGLSASKYDADSLAHLNDASTINNRFIRLLQTKLGFFSKKQYNDAQIREILKVFSWLIKNKGNLTGIQQAVQLFFHIMNAKAAAYISISDGTVQIGLESKIRDTSLLQEILWYIIPAGMYVDIFFFERNKQTSHLVENSTVLYVTTETSDDDSVSNIYVNPLAEDGFKTVLRGQISTIPIVSSEFVEEGGNV